MIYWEQRKLISCLSLLKDGTHGTHKDYPSGPLLLSAKNIKNGRVYYDETDRRISYKDFEKIHRNFTLQIGDILLTIVGSIGETALLKDSFEITFQRSVAFLRVKDNILPEFLMSEFNTDRFRNELEDRKSTSAQPGIYLGDLGKIPVFVSKNPAEQRRVGSYFESLDHLITLHQSKSFGHILEVIVSCTLSWEQRKLGECFTERTESMPKGELISVTINGGIKRFSELGRHDNSNEDKSKYKKVCIGDIAYNSMRMWQGASGYSPYNGIVSPAYTVLLANDGVNSKCIAFQFKLPRMIHVFQINSQGITSDNWNLKFPTLSDISIYISRSIDEQGKIASLLESLDHLITLHQLEPFQLIFKAIAYRIIDYAKSKPPRHTKYEIIISFIKYYA